MKATEVTPYTVPLVEYEDEVGTSSTVNGIILGVQQTSKSLCCISCQKRTVNITTTDKAVCQSCNLIQLPTTCKANWALRVLLKPENSPKNLHLRMDNNATKTLVQLINPAIQIELEFFTLLLGCQTKVFKLTYDTLTNQVSEVLLK